MSARYGINAAGRCRQCGALQTRPDTDGRGHLIDVPAPCPCPKVRPARTPAWRKDVDDARRLVGLCHLCDEPVAGKPKVALYCEQHRAERRRAVVKKSLQKATVKPWRTYYRTHHDEILQRERERYQNDPAERERRNAYKRAWRKLNRAKVAAQKKRSHRRRKLYVGDYQERYRAEVEAGARRPKTRRNKDGERLCVSPYCRQVMHGRAKKCDRCKKKERRSAAEELRRAA